jgi:hypothetical protein
MLLLLLLLTRTVSLGLLPVYVTACSAPLFGRLE